LIHYVWLFIGGVAVGYAIMTRAAGVTLVPAFVIFILIKNSGWLKEGGGLGIPPHPNPLPLGERELKPDPSGVSPLGERELKPNPSGVLPQTRYGERGQTSPKPDPSGVSPLGERGQTSPKPNPSGVLPQTRYGGREQTNSSAKTLSRARVRSALRDKFWKQLNWQAAVKDGVAFGLGALPFALLILFYNNLRSGSPFNNAYEGEGFTTPIWEGLWGLLFSTGKSVFIYAPILIILPFAFRPFWQKFKAETVFFGLLIGITLIYSGAWWSWYGGFSWGPRFLVPIMPFAILMLGVLLQRSRQWVIILFVVLFPLSVFVQMSGVAIDFNTHLGNVTKFQPGWDANYNWIPALSPLRYHFENMWNADLNVVRGLTLEQLGLNRRAGLILTPAAWLAFILGLLIICYRYILAMKRPRT
jgi:hypothetical protein